MKFIVIFLLFISCVSFSRKRVISSYVRLFLLMERLSIQSLMARRMYLSSFMLHGVVIVKSWLQISLLLRKFLIKRMKWIASWCKRIHHFCWSSGGYWTRTLRKIRYQDLSNSFIFPCRIGTGSWKIYRRARKGEDHSLVEWTTRYRGPNSQTLFPCDHSNSRYL